MWTKDSLKDVIKEKLKDYMFVVVSNREPYSHIYSENKIKCIRAVSGAVTPIDYIMQVTKGVWFATGTGDADHEVVDKNNEILVPPENPRYTLKRVWLSKKEMDCYYDGFSNSTLWPLCHLAHVRPNFNQGEWECYKKVNEKFADAILEKVGSEKAFIWIQDYHFALVAKFLKAKRPDLIVAQFWHTPWPAAEIFRICPWKKEILEGLLANDLLGFHLGYYCTNFFNSIAKELEAKIDHERSAVSYKDHDTLVKAFPIGIDYELISGLSGKSRKTREKLTEKYISGNYKYLCLSVERVDYIKGMIERLKAIDRFLEKYPEYHKRFVYLGIAPKSRMRVSTYQNLLKDVKNLVEKINWKYYTDSWYPISFTDDIFSLEELIPFYKNADICMVNSLDDGMNIVAKEFIAAADSEKGMLVLSRFTGTARELSDAVLVNPYDVEEMADAIKNALEMPVKERVEKMDKMKEIIKDKNVYRWASKFILELSNLKAPAAGSIKED